MRFFLIIFLIVLTTRSLVGQNNYEKIGWKQANKSNRIANAWIKKYGDALGVPSNAKLERLTFSPDEITLGRIDSVMHFPSAQDVLLRREIDTVGCYEIKTEYINLKNFNPQSIYFKFNRHSELTGMQIYEFDKMIYGTYH